MILIIFISIIYYISYKNLERSSDIFQPTRGFLYFFFFTSNFLFHVLLIYDYIIFFQEKEKNTYIFNKL